MMGDLEFYVIRIQINVEKNNEKADFTPIDEMPILPMNQNIDSTKAKDYSNCTTSLSLLVKNIASSLNNYSENNAKEIQMGFC